MLYSCRCRAGDSPQVDVGTIITEVHEFGVEMATLEAMIPVLLSGNTDKLRAELAAGAEPAEPDALKTVVLKLI